MKINIQFNTNYKSFKDYPLAEMSAVMSRVKTQVFNRISCGNFRKCNQVLLDSDGNEIGTLRIENED